MGGGKNIKQEKNKGGGKNNLIRGKDLQGRRYMGEERNLKNAKE